jgi:hypothetical protein
MSILSADPPDAQLEPGFPVSGLVVAILAQRTSGEDFDRLA